MRPLGVNWVGVETGEFSSMRRFFNEVMGLGITFEREGFCVLSLPDGDKLELFGPGFPLESHLFQAGPVVAGFWVADLDAALAELRQAGIELLGKGGRDQSGYRWQHFRAPDGKVFEINCDPGRADPADPPAQAGAR
ncbi:MAG: VOC family protein [Candidatus Dormibacteria bacterium]